MEVKTFYRRRLHLPGKLQSRDKVILTIGYFLIAAGYSVAFLPEEKIIALTSEDGIYENIGAGFFLLTAVIFISGFLNSDSQGFFLFRRTKKNYSFLFLAVMFFVIFGEEISWGQRLFSYNSGNFFISNNMQLETNIHNLKIFHALDENHVKKEWWQYFSLNRLFRFFWMLWCIALPVFEKINPRIANLRQGAGIPAVPVSYGLLFLINYTILKILENNISRMTEVVEIEECITAVLFFLLAFRLVYTKLNDTVSDIAEEHLSILPENSYRERPKSGTD
jgi:hypothetical protein